MSRFDDYFLMKEEDVIAYVLEKHTLFDQNASLECREIGTGNLNYIYKVRDKKTDHSVIVKQAGIHGRLNPNKLLNTDRNRRESETLILHNRLAPGFAPEVYQYDKTMSCCLMEDLSSYNIMRDELLDHKIFPLFAEHITTFMVNTLLLTSDITMNHEEKKEQVKAFINPQLCEISERLVYTDPYTDIHGKNRVFEPITDFVVKELYGDKKLHLEVAKLKFDFMNNAQSLVHGDLHTGSIFIRADSTKVIDPEFAFYGPMGYDVGSIIANLLFCWANADATITDREKRRGFLNWVEHTIADTIDLFKVKFKVAFEKHVTEIMAKTDGFLDWYLGTVLTDTAAVAGLEAIRRVVGIASVADLTSIENPDARARAEKIVITAGKNLVLRRASYNTGQDFIQLLQQTAASI